MIKLARVACCLVLLESCTDKAWTENPLENLCSKPNIADTIHCLRQMPKEDILAIPAVKSYLEKHKVYISLTSSPDRLPEIIWMLKTLDLEHVEKIYLALPEKYKNKEPYGPIPAEIEHFPKLEIIARHERDIGPATKIFYALKLVAERDPDAIVISLDDDTGLPWGGVSQLIKYAVLYPDAVVGGSGRYAKLFGISHEEGEWPDDAMTQKAPYCGHGEVSYCNVLEGYKGIAYKPRLLNIGQVAKLAEISKSCLASDDLVISYVLALNHVDRIRISHPVYFYQVNQFSVGFKPGALHKMPNAYTDGWKPRWSWANAVGVSLTADRYQRCGHEIKNQIKSLDLHPR